MRVGRLVLINVLGLLILVLVVAIGFWIWHQGYYFYSTDDAVVSVNTVSVAAVAPGVVTAIDVAPQQQVAAGTRVVSLSPVAASAAAGSGGGGSTTRSGSSGVTTTTGGSSSGSLSATSPIRGTVIDVLAAPGQLAQPGQTLAQVADLSGAYITAYVDEKSINNIQLGQGVDVTVDAINDTTFHGRVDRIIPATAGEFSLIPTNNYASGNFTKVAQRIPVIITLNGLQGKTLYPNTSASVTIHIHT